jgi:type II secretory pathway pseudopilin PulG
MNGEGPLRISGDRGFTYLSALIVIVLAGIALTGISEYWSTIAKREREKELLYRGDRIRKAIAAYYRDSPTGSSRYPGTLKDLLKDPRSMKTVRHLRKLYPDPMTKNGTWGLILAQGGGIKGVFTKSTEKPLKIGGFSTEFHAFEKAKKYSDWKFEYNPAAK